MLLMFFRFLYETAGRINEILNVRFCDLDYKKDSVSKGYIINLKEFTPDTIKGGKRRGVNITQETMDLLMAYMQRNGIKPESRQNVFSFITNLVKIKEGINAKKNLITISNRIVKKVCKAILGRDDVTNHWFRHTCLTHMAMDNVPLLGIQNYAGHTDPKTTLIYIQAADVLARQGFGEWQKKKE
jgi:integrase